MKRFAMEKKHNGEHEKREQRVLIIEDHPEQAHLMQLILNRARQNFAVRIVHDAESGLAELDKEHYDVVVLDYHLPKMNGLEALSAIQHKLPGLPVVMVTGQGDERIAVAAMRQGAADYLVKTRDYLDLLPRVLDRAGKERKLSSQLKQSEQRYFALFDRASIAIFIVRADTLQLVQVNKNAAELLGCPGDELIGRHWLDLFSNLSRQPAEAFFQKIQQENQADTDQLVLVHANRRLIPADIHASLLEIGDHRVVQFFVSDISEKVRMQHQLLLSRQRLLSLFDGITDLICVLDPSFRLIMGNKRYAQIASRQTDQVIGEKCYRALFGRSQPCENCPAHETYRTGESKFIEIFHQGRTFHIWTFPMAALDGRPEYVVEYAKDVTEQKGIEKQLIKSEKLATIGLLSSGIAHELRNPLNVIETARYALEDSLGSEDSDVVKRLAIIKKNVRRASIIIDNLLQFSRHSEFERERIDLEKLLDSTLSLVQKDIGLRKIEIRKNYRNTPRVFFSLDSLKQVFLNILMNAVQAMPNGGIISLRTAVSPDGKWTLIEFSDTGVGISEENLKHVFTPFFTTKSDRGGIGLGLYLSYTIIKREGGDILCKSRVGEGTSFIIKVPTAKADDEPIKDHRQDLRRGDLSS
ncbi:response regulator [candidate division KSB1 bacterium]|nr:response regulator [candidate division KSB1 bacterium]